MNNTKQQYVVVETCAYWDEGPRSSTSLSRAFSTMKAAEATRLKMEREYIVACYEGSDKGAEEIETEIKAAQTIHEWESCGELTNWDIQSV